MLEKMKRENYKVENLYESETVIYKLKKLLILHKNIFVDLLYRQLYFHEFCPTNIP